MVVVLTIFGESPQKRSVSFAEPGAYLIGRAEEADCVIRHKSVAPKECVLTVQGAGARIAPVPEASEIRVDGARLKKEAVLGNGSEIEIGDNVSIIVNFQDAAATGSRPASAPPSAEAPTVVPSAAPQAAAPPQAPPQPVAPPPAAAYAASVAAAPPEPAAPPPPSPEFLAAMSEGNALLDAAIRRFQAALRIDSEAPGIRDVVAELMKTYIDFQARRSGAAGYATGTQGASSTRGGRAIAATPAQIAQPAPPPPPPARPAPPPPSDAQPLGAPGEDPFIQKAVQTGEIPGMEGIRIKGVVARGRVATILEGQRLPAGEPVAVKLLDPGQGSSTRVDRFAREGKLLYGLDHPGVCKIHGDGVVQSPQGPRPYLILELVRGKPLLDHADESRLGTPQRLDLLARICDVVDHVNTHGVLHRGLKPSSILVNEKGEPKILDFGLAKEEGSSQLTAPGQIVGVLAYLSPEQARGGQAQLDQRVDVYGLGGVGYTLLSKRPPHDLAKKPLAEALDIIMNKEPASLGMLNPGWLGDIEAIFIKALAKNRDKRHASAGELARDIRRYLTSNTRARAALEKSGSTAASSAAPASLSQIVAAQLQTSEDDDKSIPAASGGRAGWPQIPNYNIRSVIAQGRFSTVYEAEYQTSGRYSAIKVSNPENHTDEQIDRFQKEGAILQKLDHPGIVKVLQTASIKEGPRERLYHIMELIQGRPLLLHCDRLELGLMDRVDLLILALDSLDYMHQRKVVHRDLKPANILVDERGQTKLIDFGIAFFAGGHDGMTSTGQLVGNLTYMSPEQLSGNAKDLDQRVDIYAVGGIAYTLFAGRPPLEFAGKDFVNAMMMIRATPPTPLGDIDPAFKGDLQKIVNKALSKDRDRRYPTAGDFAADLRLYRHGRPAKLG